MKYLVLLLVLVAVLWIARALRAPAARKPPRPAQPTGAVVGHEDLPACAHCGVYLPRSEALEGPGGVFCSEAHRAAFQARERPR